MSIFDGKSIEDIQNLIDRDINPISMQKILDSEREQVYVMLDIIFSAIYQEDTNEFFDYVEIPGLNYDFELTKQTTIQPFSQKIAESFKVFTSRKTKLLSSESIQNAILKFLSKKNLLVWKQNPYSGNSQAYFSSELGQKCGITNSIGKNSRNQEFHFVYYSAYIQAYILRMLPEILKDEITATGKLKNFKVNYLELSIEPFTEEELHLIDDFRSLNEDDKKLILQNIESIIEKPFKTYSMINVGDEGFTDVLEKWNVNEITKNNRKRKL